MARIGIDLDGCLYDFGRAFTAYLDSYCDWPRALINYDQQSWHFYRELGLSDQGFAFYCNQAADDGELWERYTISTGDRVALQDLQDAGHTLHIITDRRWGSHPGVSQASTANWLSRNEVPYDSLTFSADKTIVKTDWMFDDKPANYLALREAGCRVYAYDQPWNQELGDVARVSSVRQFADIVLTYASKEPATA